MTRAQAIVATALLTLACVASEAQSAKVRGPELFHSKGCIQCHSIGNTGGTKGPHLDAVGKRLKNEQIEHQIMNGSLAMPSFAEALSPDELRTLVEYLHSCRREIALAK
jgi:ubiquinol-cytochrome c reductase cytochrome b subunit